MGSIVLTTLSIFLGLFFIFVGSMKLTPSINRDMHREIRRNFVQYAKVFPLAKTFAFKVPSKYYRITVGWTEVICGTILVFIPGMIKQLANVLLLIMMAGAFYTHTIMEDKFERTAPSIVFALMLACRLVVFFQVRRKEKKQAKLVASKATVSNKENLNKETKQD